MDTRPCAWRTLLVCGILASACSPETETQADRSVAATPSVAGGRAGDATQVAGAAAIGVTSSAGNNALPGASAGQGSRLPTPTAGLGAPSQGSAANGGLTNTAGAPGAAGASGALATAGAAAAPPSNPAPAGDWPAADPSQPGPFETVTENNVGPGMAYTMFRPKELTRRHPVITWGNGTGTTPPTYGGLLRLYASHGFIVIASNSMNVAQGDPPPMLDGVTWVLEQDMTQGSPLYQHVDRDRIGATGHSQGAFAASSAGTDPRIKTIAPIETLGASGGLHGPVLGLCGSMDTTVPCSANMRSFSAISDQPVMYAELKTADHTNWIFSPGAPNPFWVITTAWFRVQLMDDTALRPMFYGQCTLCNDTDTWITMRKMLD